MEEQIKRALKRKAATTERCKRYEFSSIIQVPCSKDGIVIKELAKIEPRLAKSTGQNIKLVEKSGVQLGRVFDRVFKPEKCHAAKCIVCKYHEGKGGSKCRLTNVDTNR